MIGALWLLQSPYSPILQRKSREVVVARLLGKEGGKWKGPDNEQSPWFGREKSVVTSVCLKGSFSFAPRVYNLASSLWSFVTCKPNLTYPQKYHPC
jgi:hypothetical protein